MGRRSTIGRKTVVIRDLTTQRHFVFRAGKTPLPPLFDLKINRNICSALTGGLLGFS
jgi:hypothetical protein